MRISDWSSDVCSSDLIIIIAREALAREIGFDPFAIKQPLAGELAFEQDGAQSGALLNEGSGAERLEAPLVAAPDDKFREARCEGLACDGAVATARHPLPARYRQAKLNHRLRQQRRDDIAAIPAPRPIEKIGRATSELQSLMRNS